MNNFKSYQKEYTIKTTKTILEYDDLKTCEEIYDYVFSGKIDVNRQYVLSITQLQLNYLRKFPHYEWDTDVTLDIKVVQTDTQLYLNINYGGEKNLFIEVKE